MECVLAYITAKDKEEARHIGRELLKKRLVACVNILDGMESCYWWEGKLEESHEVVLIAKLEKRSFDLLVQEVKRLHSYTIPCVLEIPVSGGNPEYLNWLSQSVKEN